MFIRDNWYIAGWPSEIDEQPLRRVIMNEPVVFYRCADGTVVALEDRCSHRNFPLSRGMRDGDRLQCGYHGLIFDRSGRCVYAPGQDRPPPRADIRAYPTEERHGIIWLWMGDPAKADAARIPDLGWLDVPGWSSWRGGYIHINAPDQGLAENLLDISHLAYVHKTSIGSDPNLIAGGKIKVMVEPDGVRRLVDVAAMPKPPAYRAVAVLGDTVDQRTESKMLPGLYWNHAVTRNADLGEWPTAGAVGDYPVQIRSFHGIVPETDGGTHYFFGGAFMDIGVAVFNADMHKQILSEDVGVLEAIFANEKLIGDRPTINLRNDLGVMKWRALRQEWLGAKAERQAA